MQEKNWNERKAAIGRERQAGGRGAHLGRPNAGHVPGLLGSGSVGVGEGEGAEGEVYAM